MTDNAFLDVHVLQTVPFSNLNRDNLGTPKQMTFGGVTRSRVSSQCTKRASRLWLETKTDLGKALRTRRLPQLVREVLVRDFAFDGPDAQAAVTRLFDLAGISVKGVQVGEEEELQGDQLTFTTSETAETLATAVDKHRDAILAEGFKPDRQTKDELTGPFGQKNAIIALCGRMLADLPGSNVDGALQVAHAFTTHPSTPELDYFTAVDDEIQDNDEETGAGMIGVSEYTSGVFYRHATVGIGLLSDSLDGAQAAVAEVARNFVEAFTVAEPTGKQNAANAHTMPALIAATLRSDRPVSLATAFESPVRPNKHGGHLSGSIARLGEHARDINDFYGSGSIIGAWYAAVGSEGVPEEAGGLGARVNGLNDLLDTVEEAVGAVG
ncbi:type I-E CRISPR-associated protein Cas7/Cse4/CasC [Candidatus Poriferisocius sp.]|uniref:type I-E CRISPR-associated protein Cas7/Cse4/CasC n=1 Tax=Candidatus Poriferisocius sp. TaxID=3101276 RepID=UPI003B01049E